MKNFKLFGLALLVAVAGCAKVNLSCPVGQTVQATVAGQDFAAFTSALGSIVTIAGPLVAANKPPVAGLKATAPTGPASAGTVSVSTTTFGGPTSVTCTDTPAGASQ